MVAPKTSINDVSWGFIYILLNILYFLVNKKVKINLILLILGDLAEQQFRGIQHSIIIK